MLCNQFNLIPRSAFVLEYQDNVRILSLVTVHAIDCDRINRVALIFKLENAFVMHLFLSSTFSSKDILTFHRSPVEYHYPEMSIIKRARLVGV